MSGICRARNTDQEKDDSMERLTKDIHGYAHGKSGRSIEEALKSHEYYRGVFESTGIIEALSGYERTGLTSREIVALQVEISRLKAAMFNLAIRDGGVPCEYCKFRYNESADGCRACQSAEFDAFKFGGAEK